MPIVRHRVSRYPGGRDLHYPVLEQDTFACGCTGIKSITKTFNLVPSS